MPAGQVDIVTVQPDQFTDPHAGDDEQSDDDLVGRHPQRLHQRLGGSPEQPVDVALGVQVRRDPVPAVAQQAG